MQENSSIFQALPLPTFYLGHELDADPSVAVAQVVEQVREHALEAVARSGIMPIVIVVEAGRHHGQAHGRAGTANRPSREPLNHQFPKTSVIVP